MKTDRLFRSLIWPLIAPTFLGLLVLPLASGPARGAVPDEPAAATVPDFEETWQSVYIGGSRVGFGRTTTEKKERGGRPVIATDAEMSLSIVRFGQSAKTKMRTRTLETLAGDLLEFDFELLNPPAASTRKTGRVDQGRLLIETETAGKTTPSEMPWDGSLKAPGYQDRMLKQNPLKPGEARTIRTFDPQFGKTDVKLEARGDEETTLLDGTKKKLRKVTITLSSMPGIALDEYLDAKGEALISKSILGMVIHKVSKEEALKALTGEETDLAVSTLVKTAPLVRPTDTKRVRYRLTIPGEDPAKIVAVGPTQTIQRAGPNAVDLTVTAITPPGNAPAGAAAPAREFLDPNEYIQSDDRRVRALADEAAAGESDPWATTRKMEQWVHKNLKEKNFSTLLASAAEVARDLQGDCTEHAVLLAAMARAKGIPSRVAIGLVYVGSRSSFGGHMWTEVLIGGTWVPLDATLGQGGIAADHIKFADSSFGDKGIVSPLTTFLPLVSVLGKLQIEIREVEHR